MSFKITNCEICGIKIIIDEEISREDADQNPIFLCGPCTEDFLGTLCEQLYLDKLEDVI